MKMVAHDRHSLFSQHPSEMERNGLFYQMDIFSIFSGKSFPFGRACLYTFCKGSFHRRRLLYGFQHPLLYGGDSSPHFLHFSALGERLSVDLDLLFYFITSLGRSCKRIDSFKKKRHGCSRAFSSDLKEASYLSCFNIHIDSSVGRV